MTAAGNDVPARRGLAALVRRRPLTTYCVLLAVLSWPVQLVLPPAVVVVGPSVCAFVVVGVAEGRRGVRELWSGVLRWRVPGRYYAFALLALGAYLLGSVLAFTMLADPDRIVPQAASTLLVTALVNLPIQIVLAGLGEEFGWRGFALTRLQERHGPLAAAVVVGLLWAVWHFPLRIAAAGGITMNLVWTVVGITAASCVYAWVFNSTGGSIALVAVLHGAENSWMGRPFELLYDPGSPDFYSYVAVWNAAYVVLAVVVVAATRGRLGLRAGPDRAVGP